MRDLVKQGDILDFVKGSPLSGTEMWLRRHGFCYGVIQYLMYVHWGLVGLAVLIAANNYVFEAHLCLDVMQKLNVQLVQIKMIYNKTTYY